MCVQWDMRTKLILLTAGVKLYYHVYKWKSLLVNDV